MMYKFERQEAGFYVANFNDGYTGVIARNPEGQWTGGIFKDPTDKATLAVSCTRKTLAEAKDYLDFIASYIRVTKKNYLTGVGILVSINTPSSCDPSSEAYYCM